MINTKDEIFRKKDNESFNEYCHRITLLKDSIMEATWTTIANIINDNTGVDYSADKYRKQEKRYQTLNSNNLNDEDESSRVKVNDESDYKDTYIDSNRETITINYDKNEMTSCKDIPLSNQDLKDQSALLRAHGFDPRDFIIKTATNTKTNRTTINGKISIYTSRIVVKPKTATDVTLEDVEQFFNTFNPRLRSPLTIKPKQYDPNGEFLEICVQDLHAGLLAYEQEAGEDYDLQIAKDRLSNCIADVYQRSKGRKFKRIVFALIGDILHVDNLDLSTSGGTRQDVDTRPSKIFEEMLDLLIDVISKLGEIAPVEVINVPGNHDRLCGFMLAKSLEVAFRSDSNVKFYNSPNPRKWIRYNNVLLGYAHGDMKPQAITEWLSNECEEWSLAKYREVHLGHLHSIQTMQKIEDNKYGLIARYLPALCSSSAWEHISGFPKSQRGLMSFVWNEDTGLREIWYSNI